VNIISARAIRLKAPLDTPYRTTFQTMTHRQAVLVMLTDERGLTGVGETYINFPLWAATGRMAAYREAFFPMVVGHDIEDPGAFTRDMWRRLYRAALQGGCIGSTLQALSAVSTALWDLSAKREGVPLSRLFSDNPAEKVRIYASGINPPLPTEAIRDALDMGMEVFKLKLGFGKETDTENIRALKTLIGDARVAVDVNRSWRFDEAVEWLGRLGNMDIAWVEEPLAPEDEHRYPELVELAGIPVSAGENFRLPPGSDFVSTGRDGLSLNGTRLAVDIVQPAVVKNCCFDDGVRFALFAETREKLVYPHFLGSAPGMAASAHLAALTRNPHLEWDINPNPLRTDCFTMPFRGRDGFLAIPDTPGIGWEISPEMLDQWTVDSVDVHA